MEPKDQMLTTYFEANNLHVKARGILYRDFPEYYTWQRRGKFWQERKRATLSQVGRIVSAHPAEGERYYLRVLLNHVTGATSYEDLRTVNGQVMPTFHEVAEKQGLIEAQHIRRMHGRSKVVSNAIISTKALCNNIGILLAK